MSSQLDLGFEGLYKPKENVTGRQVTSDKVRKFKERQNFRVKNSKEDGCINCFYLGVGTDARAECKLMQYPVQSNNTCNVWTRPQEGK